MNERRIGFVGIIIENRIEAGSRVNTILAEHGDHVVARVGIPYRERECCVITLVVDMTTDELGVLTGQLGMVSGVSVKSALSKGDVRHGRSLIRETTNVSD